MPAVPHNAECKSQNCVAGFFQKTANGAHEDVRGEQLQIKDTDNRRGQRGRRDAR